MITGTPSIYNSISIYNGGGGGNDDSPDLPDNLKKYYKQIESLKTTSDNKIFCNDLNQFNSSDIYILDSYIWKLQDVFNDIVKATTSNDNVGQEVFRINVDSYFSTTESSFYANTGSSGVQVYSDHTVGKLYKVTVNNPNFYINDSIKANNVPFGTDKIGVSVRVFWDGCNFTFKRLKILDKNSVVKKVDLLPVIEKSTGYYGILDLITESFFKSSNHPETGLEEYAP